MTSNRCQSTARSGIQCTFKASESVVLQSSAFDLCGNHANMVDDWIMSGCPIETVIERIQSGPTTTIAAARMTTGSTCVVSPGPDTGRS